jgi:two-component system, sensor histidine kinase PdtaS
MGAARRTEKMTVLYLHGESQHPELVRSSPKFDPVAYYQRALQRQTSSETGLRQDLADKNAQLGEMDELLRHQENLGREADHRLMNALQTVVSLLSLQSRAAQHPEAAAQLTVAANRVAMIARVHRRLHSFDGEEVVAFKTYLEDLCRDFAVMLSPYGQPEHPIAVEAAELSLPVATGIPLGFIVAELITNAAKHGEGNISVRLETQAGKGHALSVVNDGSVLPEDFDPAAAKGLGMKIIRSFVAKIDGELRFGRDENGIGTRFTVLFS